MKVFKVMIVKIITNIKQNIKQLKGKIKIFFCNHDFTYRAKGAWSYGACDKCDRKVTASYYISQRPISNKFYSLSF